MDFNFLVFSAPKPTYTNKHMNLVYINKNYRNHLPKESKRVQGQYIIKAKIQSQLKNYESHVRSPLKHISGKSNDKNSSKRLETISERINTQNSIMQQQFSLYNDKNLIPCVFQEFQQGSDTIVIYFHGNAEDLGSSIDLMGEISKQLKVHVLGVEYPGYGVYKGTPNEQDIIKDSEIVFDYLNHVLQVPQKNIILIGRSIGCGPAIHLSATKRPGSCVLISAYTSIRGIVKDIFGELLQYCVSERFVNISKIGKVKCPTCFIHGEQDKMINYQHSLQLMEKCQGITVFNLQEAMSHNEFNFLFDVIIPVRAFLAKSQQKIQIGQQMKDKYRFQEMFLKNNNSQMQQSCEL